MPYDAFLTPDEEMGPPDFTFDNGTKFWIERGLTKKAGRKHKVCLAALEDGEKAYVILDKDGVIYEDKTFEGIACRLDVLKIMRGN